MTAKPGSNLRRFGGYDIEDGRAVGLRHDHPALTEARTIFPSTVVSSAASPRLLVSGMNNPKLGKMVTKGPRAGWPIYQLTLEERATCPRSCEQWSACYGNAMHRARRHAADHTLIPILANEVAELSRKHPNGFLVRLHTLGDFFSTEYVYAWETLLLQHKPLHVFGYTSRRPSEVIGREIGRISTAQWDRFAIRFSGHEAIVVDEDPRLPGVVVCPAQTGATQCCGTCGLCWNAKPADLTIAFKKHGMKGRPHVVD